MLLFVMILYRRIIKYIEIERIKAGVYPDRPVDQRPVGAAMLLQDMVQIEVEK